MIYNLVPQGHLVPREGRKEGRKKERRIKNAEGRKRILGGKGKGEEERKGESTKGGKMIMKWEKGKGKCKGEEKGGECSTLGREGRMPREEGRGGGCESVKGREREVGKRKRRRGEEGK